MKYDYTEDRKQKLHGKTNRLSRGGNLTDKEVREIREEYANGDVSQRKLAELYGISLPYVNDILNYRRRTHG
jgi:DNA-binding transcriptional regulator YiaG